MNRLVAMAAGLFFVATCGPAGQAWDNIGHLVISSIAYEKLDATTRRTVDLLTIKMSSPGHSYNPETLSVWMDDIRKDPAMPSAGLFKSWHYIDIPIDSRDPMPSFEPGTDNEVRGNAVQGLKRAMVVLKGGTDPYVKDQAMALAIVEHLVGDLHQPLHCATKYFFSHGEWRDDKGGNDEFVLNGPPGNDKFNLHAFWDSAYRATFDPASGDVEIPQDVDAVGLADSLRDTAIPPAQLKIDFDAWARESNAVARDFVYPGITATDDRKSCRLSSSYVAHARELARQRLVLAGYRLAALLNATLGSATPVPPPPSYPAGPPAESY